MSRPRKIAWVLLVLTVGLIGVEFVLVGGAGPVHQLLLAGGVLAKVMLCVGWVLRLRGRLPMPGRHALWPVAAVLFGASGIAALGGLGRVLPSGVLALSAVALGLAAWGLVAERRRTSERLTFVLRDG